MHILYITLSIIVNFILQSTILSHFKIFGVVPNTALILVVIISLAKGKYYGGISGLIIGLLQDIMFSDVIGINALIFFFAGYLIGFIEDTFARDNLVNPIIFTAATTVYYNIMYSLFLFFLGREILFENAVKSVFSIEVIFNALLSILVYKIFQKILFEPSIRFGRR